MTAAPLAFPARAERRRMAASAPSPGVTKPVTPAPVKRKEPRNMDADRVKAIRTEAKLTQAGLAALLRLGASGKRTVRRWEAGEIPITGPASILLEMLGDGVLPKRYRGGGK